MSLRHKTLKNPNGQSGANIMGGNDKHLLNDHISYLMVIRTLYWTQLPPRPISTAHESDPKNLT